MRRVSKQGQIPISFSHLFVMCTYRTQGRVLRGTPGASRGGKHNSFVLAHFRKGSIMSLKSLISVAFCFALPLQMWLS